MDSESLCDTCNTIDFGAAGFYGSDVNYDHIRFFRKLSLDRVLQNLERCFFCRKIAGFYNDWKLQKFPDYAPDLEDAHLAVCSCDIPSLEIDDKRQPKWLLVYIEVSLIVKKPPPSEGYFCRTVRFQKCSQHPLTVTDVCSEGSLLDWESGQEHQAYCGRIRPLVAIPRLFHKWKETCCAVHNDHCKLSFSEDRLPQLRLIDVVHRCVVDRRENERYVALSYVWGYKFQLLKLKKSNDEELRELGSLKTEMLPSTIDDAMEVTRGLGERYIWIDCLCIMQDDEFDKQKLIPVMDLIYGCAVVTIIAASGVKMSETNAGANLPGVKPNSRTREQTPFTIKGVSLLEKLEPEGSREFVQKADTEVSRLSYLGECVWNTRGWTFQEKIFSGRALIFTQDQVYWECQRALWCEDSFSETTKCPIIFHHSLGTGQFRHPWVKDVHSFEKIYEKLVVEYSARGLSFPSDGLNAFAGILNYFERQVDQCFLWALPAPFLSHALTWSCVTSGTRRPCTRTLEDGTSIPCHFPSWSWVGWVGQVLIPTGPYLSLEPIDLIFYHLDDSGMPNIVPAVAATQTRSQTFIWKEQSRTIVTREDIPESVFSLSIAPIILCFWSSAAILHICSRHGELNLDDQPTLSHNGRLVPGVWLHLPLLDRPQQQLGEFVVIGRDTYNTWEKNRITLLFVSWEDGVAYRQGLVTINSNDWGDLDNRVWKLITLG